jgi:hypothetical protein
MILENLLGRSQAQYHYDIRPQELNLFLDNQSIESMTGKVGRSSCKL